MRAVCYLRAIAEPSLEAQQEAALTECARADLEVGRTFVETAVPSDAPEFRRMLQSILEPGEPPAEVVVGAIEALGDTVRLQAKRWLQCLGLGVTLRVPGNRSLEALLSEGWEQRSSLERRREQVRAGMRDVALRGEVLGRPPYGYRVVARRLRIDPVEADVVREIFHRYLDLGEGVRVIARYLNDAGIQTRRGWAWSMVSVREVLRNPVYVGTYRRLGVVVPSDHERLVTAERFAEVQHRLRERRTSFERQPRAEYLLAGLAVCGECGNHLVGVRRRSRARVAEGEAAPVFTYYQCQSRTNQSRCAYHTRRTDELEATVREALRNAPLDVPSHVSSAVGESSSHGALSARREALRRQLDTLLERWMRGEFTAERFREQAAPLALDDLQEEEREAFEARRGHDLAADSSIAARLLAEWDELSFAERRRLLRATVTSVVVADDDVRVEFVG